jgi:hypothetical protein
MTNPTCPYPEFISFIDDDGDDDIVALLAVASNELMPSGIQGSTSDRIDD